MDCCSEGPRWTLSTLVAAFVDLAIAYLLLCCSAISFLAANFLYFFGLRLPCPYFHTFLVHSTPRAVASVQVSALASFPFRRCQLGSDDKGGVSEGRPGSLVVDGGTIGSGDVVLLRDSESSLGIDGLSPRHLHPPPPPPSQLEWREPSRSLSPQNLVQSGILSVDTEKSGFDSDCNSDGLSNWEVGKGKGVEKTESQRLDRSDKETIRVLERALEEEQSARSALYIELEEERSSAATAADEAMAMIERLQKEKATLDMNARQYQRMVEEKTTYDEEEMEILKEIIVRQERELYVLGKEVGMLRQMMDSTGGTQSNLQHVLDDDEHEMVDFEGDPLKMLQQITDSNKKKEAADCQNDNGHHTTSAEGREILALELSEASCSLSHDGSKGAESLDNTHVELLPMNADEDNMEFQEKGIVSVDVYAPDVESQIPKSNDVLPDVFKLEKPPEHGVDDRSPLPPDGGNEQNHDKVEIRSQHDDAVKKNIDSSSFVPEFRTLDLHVINDRTFSQTNRDKFNSRDRHLPTDGYDIRNVETMSDRGSASWATGDQNIQRNRSDSASAHSMVASSFDSSGSTMSSVDGERTKLESEVEGLKERLRIIQQVRKKLNLSVEQTQKENFLLQLLQEITDQLQEIRQLSNPAKTTRRASLPPPSSKVNSRKRRSRSDS